MSMNRPKLVTVSLALSLLVLVASSASATAYIVVLKNGNTMISKYKPIDAPYNSSKSLIMTEAGNVISLSKDDIEEVIADVENRGFGVIIDTTTILVGYSANDAPNQEDLLNVFDPNSVQQQLQLYQLQQLTTGGGGGGGGLGGAPAFNSPLIGEPNSGGGLPVNLIGSPAIPTSPVQNNSGS